MKLTDYIADFFEENGNIPVCDEEIKPYIVDNYKMVKSDTIRKMMSLDPRFESVAVEGKNYKKWRLKVNLGTGFARIIGNQLAFL